MKNNRKRIPIAIAFGPPPLPTILLLQGTVVFNWITVVSNWITVVFNLVTVVFSYGGRV